jgi:DNA-binding transcriptional LysR family regulator
MGWRPQLRYGLGLERPRPLIRLRHPLRTKARLCAHAGFRPRVAREVLEPSTIIGLVAAGVGVAIVPDGILCIRLGKV